jgi:hypothetical protein
MPLAKIHVLDVAAGWISSSMDLEADMFVTERVDAVGTRHRSAYRTTAIVKRSPTGITGSVGIERPHP